MAFVAGAGIGYILGARAGREQYEKIMNAAAMQKAREVATARGNEFMDTAKHALHMGGEEKASGPGRQPTAPDREVHNAQQAANPTWSNT